MRFVIAIAALAFTAIQSPAQKVILGVLEDVPGVYAGEADSPGVRVVFRYDGSRWSAYPTCHDQQCLVSIVSKYPAHSAWTIGFDGHAIGNISSRTPPNFKFYSHIGLQEIENRSSVPWVGKKSAEFGGFLDEAVYRPLVANSQPDMSDPDGWKATPVPPQIRNLLRKAFRQRYPKLCKSSAADETKLVPFAYRDNAIKVAKAYKSKVGAWVAGVHLSDAIACDDTEAGFQIDDPWFVVRPDKVTEYLDEGFWLVDAGDYDHDGRSELLFSIDRYNRGGYVLFYDELRRHVTFTYSYH